MRQSRRRVTHREWPACGLRSRHRARRHVGQKLKPHLSAVTPDQSRPPPDRSVRCQNKKAVLRLDPRIKGPRDRHLRPRSRDIQNEAGREARAVACNDPRLEGVAKRNPGFRSLFLAHRVHHIICSGVSRDDRCSAINRASTTLHQNARCSSNARSCMSAEMPAYAGSISSRASCRVLLARVMATVSRRSSDSIR